jgi:predicted RNA binding protein YcfA (HicA-like mRNA interferase family)
VANEQRTLDAVLRGTGIVSFRDFERLLLRLGFKLARIAGSHHIYVHPLVGRPFPVQPDGKDAKRYQVRQLRDIIERHRLTLGGDS